MTLTLPWFPPAPAPGPASLLQLPPWRRGCCPQAPPGAVREALASGCRNPGLAQTAVCVRLARVNGPFFSFTVGVTMALDV